MLIAIDEGALTVVPSLRLVLVVLVDGIGPPAGSAAGSVISATDHGRLLAQIAQTLPDLTNEN
jgi:hypothetical protein